MSVAKRVSEEIGTNLGEEVRQNLGLRYHTDVSLMLLSHRMQSGLGLLSEQEARLNIQ